MHDGMEIEFDPVILRADQMQPKQYYLRVSKRLFVHERFGHDEWTTQLAARHHPRRERYDVAAAVRAVVHASERPGSVVCGFTALALYRLPYLVEGADTTLRAAVRATLPASTFRPAVARLRAPHTETWTLTHRGMPIRTATPARATIQALQQIRAGEHSWQTEPVPGVAAEVVRAVQLVDCVRRHLGLQVPELQQAAAGQLSKRWLSKVLNLSRDTADSPKETELRLLLQPVVEKYNLMLVEQYPLVVGGRVVTTFDFAIPELKLGIMYDGSHHWTYEQRQLDSSINLTSIMHGWTVPRTASRSMRQCVEVVEAVLKQKLGVR